MRFLTAVALAVVMLWVPVDASGQEVTIEAVEMRIDATNEAYIIFESRNQTSRTIVAWRGNLQISNPFGDLIWEREVIFGKEGDLPPNGRNRNERLTASRYTRSGFRLWDYELKDLEFVWTKIQVAY